MKQNTNLKQKSVLFISQAAVIAALYVVLSMLSEAVGLCSGVIQCRISEALTILPAFFAPAIPGLYVGCLLTNLISSGTIWDIIFGPVATLIGALGTWLIGRAVRTRALSKASSKSSAKAIPVLRIVILTIMFALPPIIANGVIIPPVLKFGLGLDDAFWFIVVTVTAGEIIACGVFGGLLLSALLNNAYTRRMLGDNNSSSAAKAYNADETSVTPGNASAATETSATPAKISDSFEAEVE